MDFVRFYRFFNVDNFLSFLQENSVVFTSFLIFLYKLYIPQKSMVLFYYFKF